ncbi:MAG: type I restriction enzyme HsdR N-terminal domain-containing protein, partial [Desulfovibrionaceae bacterium]|nr:type I restriction enzyme HsdR N-terminal domain-containing protein [Desulfovibrionaceae bacterium]
AVVENGKPILLIECKAIGSELDSRKCNQLQLYFHGTEAPIAILTDGNCYKFFSDLESANRMDNKPYMEIIMEKLDESLIPELRKLAKGKFDREVAMSAAHELKYNREFKQILARQLEQPHEDFVRFFISQAYDGIITQRIREHFTPLLITALNQFLDEKLNERLQSAITKPVNLEQEIAQEKEVEDNIQKITTTEEEMEAYYIVKSILVGTVDVSRVTMRDAINYCSILLDDNNRKPVCRLHFNNKQWRVGLFDGEDKDDRVNINALEDILSLSDRIRATVLKYTN